MIRRVFSGLADALQETVAELSNPEPWAAAVAASLVGAVLILLAVTS